MPNHFYSKEVQIEIFEEIFKNQGTTKTVNTNEPVRSWNYSFLLEQEYIKQNFSGGRDAPMLIGEEITDTGKVWRSTLYENIKRERDLYRTNWYIAGTFFVTLMSIGLSVALRFFG